MQELKAQLARWRKEVARLQSENYRLRTQLVGFLHGPQPLTPGQRQLFQCLAATIRDRGIAPTFRELQALLGVRSLGSVTQRLDALEAKGWIARKSRRTRAIRLLVQPEDEEEG